jgi:hypothetical protein
MRHFRFSTRVLFILLIITSGCASKPWVYRDTPYSAYLSEYYDQHDKESQRIRELVGKTIDLPPETYWVHFEIANWAYRHDQLGTALFALNEISIRFPEDRGYYHYYNVFNIGWVLHRLGLKDAARGRFEYVMNKCNNYLLKNRCTAILIKYDLDEEIKEDYYVTNF